MGKKKTLIIVLGLLLVISIIVFVISLVNKPSEEDYNIEGIELPQYKEILKDKTMGDFKLTDISLITVDGMSTYKAKLHNNSSETLAVKKLIFKKR